jgi:hypothetical protein
MHALGFTAKKSGSSKKVSGGRNEFFWTNCVPIPSGGVSLVRVSFTQAITRKFETGGTWAAQALRRQKRPLEAPVVLEEQVEPEGELVVARAAAEVAEHTCRPALIAPGFTSSWLGSY